MKDENETNVAAAPSSQEPAETAATEHTDELAGGAPIAPIAEAKETSVSPLTADQVRQIISDYLFANPPTIGIKQMEDLGDHFDRKLAAEIKDFEDGAVARAKEYTDTAIENAKADMLKHLTGLVKPIVAASTAAAAIEPSPVGPHELVVGDPVKVWVDKRANTFRLGEIAAIHDGAHAFDVKLDDGTVTKINADGVQFDDRR